MQLRKIEIVFHWIRYAMAWLIVKMIEMRKDVRRVPFQCQICLSTQPQARVFTGLNLIFSKEDRLSLDFPKLNFYSI